jgi:hypothetical protein
MRVGFFSSILVSAASQTSKHKLHNPTGNIKTINNEKKKTKEWFRSVHERGLEREKYLDRGLWRWEQCSSLWSEEVEAAQRETEREQTRESESEREGAREMKRGRRRMAQKQNREC